MKAKEYTLAHCLLAPLKKFPSSDANPVQSPSSGILRPLRSFRHWGNSPQPTVPQNHASPLVAPSRPRVAEQAMACSGRNPRVRSTRLFLSEKHRVSPPREGLCGEFTPQVGERPAPPGQGPVWAPQGRVWQKSPEKQGSRKTIFIVLLLSGWKQTAP